MKRFVNPLSLLIIIVLFSLSSSNEKYVFAAPLTNPICGTWLYVTYPVGGVSFSAYAILADAILADGVTNPYLVPGASGQIVGNRYCIYDPVVEPQSPPVSTNEGYYITEKISSYSSIQSDNGSAPSANFDAWPLEGDAPLPVKMQCVDCWH